jgi:TatD DNase family protein
MLVDSHCHLDFPELEEDRAGVIARAKAAGVTSLVTISTRVAKFATYAAIADSDPDIWCTVGTHPLGVFEEPDVPLERLLDLSSHPKCVGIGEAGLDYHYDTAPRDVAERVFRTHIEAARLTKLPLVIHARDCDEDMIRIVTDEMGKGAFPALLHCFSSGTRLAEIGVDLGLSVSFSGTLTFKKSDEIRAIAKRVPLDRLLVETDAPFLAPQKHRGKRNEPSFVTETAAMLADVHGLTYDQMAVITTDNFFSLFSKAVRPQ